MCGIGFIVNYSNKKIDLSFVRHLLEQLENRGGEATGYYYERPTTKGMVRGINKAPYNAELFWKLTQDRELFEDDEKYKKFISEIKNNKTGMVETLKIKKEDYKQHKLTGRERLIMLHTRLKTSGSEFNNLNNHPIFSEKSKYVLIHNGQIYEGYVKKYPYLAQVDSEDILANIETYGISKGLRKVAGSMAIAFKKMTEDTLYIYRNSNPIDLVYMPKEKLLIGSSDEKYVRRTENDLEKPDLTKMLIENNFRAITIPSNMLFSIDLKKPVINWEEKINVLLYGNSSSTNFDRPDVTGFDEKDWYEQGCYGH